MIGNLKKKNLTNYLEYQDSEMVVIESLTFSQISLIWLSIAIFIVHVAVLSPGQTLATSQHKISQQCWLSISKLRPNDRNISMQRIATLLRVTCCVRLATLLQGAATCCGWKSNLCTCLGATLCTNLAKRLQHRATSTNAAWKIWPVSNLSQQYPTCRNRVAKRKQHVALNNVAICCAEMLRSFGRSFRRPRDAQCSRDYNLLHVMEDSLKPQPNDRNSSMQHIATLLAQ